MVKLMKRLYYIVLFGVLWGCSPNALESPEEIVRDITGISAQEVNEPILIESEEPKKAEEELPISFYSTRASTDVCKIKDGLTDFRGPTGIGTDLKEYSLTISGTLRIAVVYLDFADYRWQRTESTYELTQFLIDPIQSYFDEMSGGVIQFDWVIFDEIISLSRRAEEYNITRGFDHKRIDIKAEVNKTLEKRFNLNEWDVILWMINPDVPEHIADLTATSLIVGANETYSYHMALIGMDTRIHARYTNIVHEIGHMFGLADLYINMCDGHQDCQNGFVDWRLAFQYAGSWSVMSIANHSNNELMGWERFIIGWVHDDDFHCINTEEEHIIKLQPLNTQSGIRIIGVNLSNHKNLIIELRQQGPYCQTCETGLLVYTVDTTRALQEGHIHIVKPDHISQATLEDALLLPINNFNSIEYNNWRIELMTQYQEGIAVRVSKIES